MKIVEVSYRMLRVVKQFENDTAEATVQLDDGDDVQKAFETARKECSTALAAGRDAGLKDKLNQQLSTTEGREELNRFLDKKLGCKAF